MEKVKRISLLLVIVFAITGCGLSDWTYEMIGGYEIIRCNSEDILLRNDREMIYPSSSLVIPNYRVTDFCFNDRYIGLRTIRYKDVWTDEQDFPEVENGIPIGGQAFYLVDTFSDEVCGPFADKKTYDAKCVEWGTGDMGIWRSTDKEPV